RRRRRRPVGRRRRARGARGGPVEGAGGCAGMLSFDGWHRYPIGTWSFGTCDRVDEDHVVTDFVCVIVPVWPLRSYYAHRQGDRDKYEEIRLNGRSVALGYARALTWMAAWMISLAVVCAWPQWGWMW